MYGIYANIWGILMGNVTIYSIHTDPMGYCFAEFSVNHHQSIGPGRSWVNGLGGVLRIDFENAEGNLGFANDSRQELGRGRHAK